MPVAAKSPADLVQYLLENGRRTARGCLISHLAPNKKGYVPLSVGGRTGKKVRAHRFIYEQLFGELLKEELVMHECDVRNCIEPNHLYVGDAQDNSDDMKLKGRQRNQTTIRSCGRVSIIL